METYSLLEIPSTCFMLIPSLLAIFRGSTESSFQSRRIVAGRISGGGGLYRCGGAWVGYSIGGDDCSLRCSTSSRYLCSSGGKNCGEYTQQVPSSYKLPLLWFDNEDIFRFFGLESPIIRG